VINDLRIPIVNNADAKLIRTAAELKPSLVRQISSPLYWEDSINRLTAEGVDTFIEIGPGKVLSGLVKRIAKAAKVLHVEDQKSMGETLGALGF
jgi:[acyl-carrier-protein] S-malonyltransferase